MELRLRLNFIQGTEEERKEEGLRLRLKFIPYTRNIILIVCAHHI